LIKKEINKIFDTGDKYYYKLSGNKDFRKWVKRRGDGRKMHKDIKKHLSYMPRFKIKRQLWNIYRWTESPDGRTSKRGFLQFLRDVNRWFLRYSREDDDDEDWNEHYPGSLNGPIFDTARISAAL